MSSILVQVALVLFAVILAVVGLVSVMVAIRAGRGARTNDGLDLTEQPGRYPEGYWMGVGLGIGIALGAALGVAMGLAMDRFVIGFAIGPGMGVALGAAIGSSLEQRHKDEVRPLTADERRMRSLFAVVVIAALAIGVLALLAVLAATVLG